MPIVVVNDTEDPDAVTREALAQCGHEDVAFFASADDAIGRLLTGYPADVVILDIATSSGERAAACARIRAIPAHRETPILVVAARHDDHGLRQALTSGATDCLSWPISAAELDARLRGALKLKAETDRRKTLERDMKARAAPAADFIDAATGALSAATAHAVLDWAAAAEPTLPVGVIMTRIDHYPRYRLAHGERAAVELRRRVAEIIGLSSPGGSVLAAYDADALATVLRSRDLTAQSLELTGRRIEAAVRSAAFSHLDSPAGPIVTASIGVACGPAGQAGWRPLSEAFHHADTASRAGGGRVWAVRPAA